MDGITEVAPRAFEIVLRYTTAVHRSFERVVKAQTVLGHEVETVEYVELPPEAHEGLEAVLAGEFAPLAVRPWTGELDDEAGVPRPVAVLDAVVGGSGWVIVTRSAWCELSYGQANPGMEHLMIVLDPSSGPIRLFRLIGADALTSAAFSAVRESLRRELVLRPVFENSIDFLATT